MFSFSAGPLTNASTTEGMHMKETMRNKTDKHTKIQLFSWESLKIAIQYKQDITKTSCPISATLRISQALTWLPWEHYINRLAA